MFFTLSKTNFSFSARFILSSASAFNLDQSKILSFGKELRHTLISSRSIALEYYVMREFFNSFPNKRWFLCVNCTSPTSTGFYVSTVQVPLWENQKLLVTSNFSFFYGVFYLFGEFSAIFIKSEIVVCNVFEFGV